MGESGHGSFHPEGGVQVRQSGPRNTNTDFAGYNWELAGTETDLPGKVQNPETRQAQEGFEGRVSKETQEVEVNSQCQEGLGVTGKCPHKADEAHLKRV